MINWRDGKAGFVGASKRLIRGVFQYSYTVTTETVVTQGPGFGVGSVIRNNGVGKLGLMNNDGVGESGSIVLGFGVGSVIRNNGVGKTSLINNDGVGKEGEI